MGYWSALPSRRTTKLTRRSEEYASGECDDQSAFLFLDSGDGGEFSHDGGCPIFGVAQVLLPLPHDLGLLLLVFGVRFILDFFDCGLLVEFKLVRWLSASRSRSSPASLASRSRFVSSGNRRSLYPCCLVGGHGAERFRLFRLALGDVSEIFRFLRVGVL